MSHDALRLLARHHTGLLAVAEEGVRLYASMPFGPDASALARLQASCWADSSRRLEVARRMYAIRLGEVLPGAEISVLRGIEGARMKETYKRLADQFGLPWKGRRYDRANPDASDPPNAAINHASSAVEAASLVATAVVGALPQLGFIHEDSGVSFCLDIADLFRDSVTLPVAFGAVHESERTGEPLERCVRRLAGSSFRREKLIPKMIDRIRELIDADDRGGDP